MTVKEAHKIIEENGNKEFGQRHSLPEARWCRTCVRRDTCQIKEAVAEEQNLAVPYPAKYLEITVKCRKYIKDGKLPSENGDYLRSMFIR